MDGLRVKLSKCQFMQGSVEYLGHRIDKEGLLHPPEEKVAAIVNAPNQIIVTVLRAFLGLLNYYGRLYKICPAGFSLYTIC